ncbi:hypothetical protein D3C84_776590 [compost metagenome]
MPQRRAGPALRLPSRCPCLAQGQGHPRGRLRPVGDRRLRPPRRRQPVEHHPLRGRGRAGPPGPGPGPGAHAGALLGRLAGDRIRHPPSAVAEKPHSGKHRRRHPAPDQRAGTPAQCPGQRNRGDDAALRGPGEPRSSPVPGSHHPAQLPSRVPPRRVAGAGQSLAGRLEHGPLHHHAGPQRIPLYRQPQGLEPPGANARVPNAGPDHHRPARRTVPRLRPAHETGTA